jgi:hypothetical protein
MSFKFVIFVKPVNFVIFVNELNKLNETNELNTLNKLLLITASYARINLPSH